MEGGEERVTEDGESPSPALFNVLRVIKGFIVIVVGAEKQLIVEYQMEGGEERGERGWKESLPLSLRCLFRP